MQLLTVKQAAAQLAVSERTVYRLLDEKKIPRIKMGGCARIRQDDLDNYIERSTENRVYGDKGFRRFHYVNGMNVV